MTRNSTHPKHCVSVLTRRTQLSKSKIRTICHSTLWNVNTCKTFISSSTPLDMSVSCQPAVVQSKNAREITSWMGEHCCSVCCSDLVSILQENNIQGISVIIRDCWAGGGFMKTWCCCRVNQSVFSEKNSFALKLEDLECSVLVFPGSHDCTVADPAALCHQEQRKWIFAVRDQLL